MSAQKTKQPAAGSGKTFTEEDYDFLGRVMADAYEFARKRKEAAAADSKKASDVAKTAFDCSALLGVASPSPAVHTLKTWKPFYEAVAGGRKPFECRKADRNFQLGDILKLEEWDRETESYTGRSCERIISCRLYGPCFGVEAGWVVLGLATPNKP